ncbi:hypothetical protein [Streptomyces coelicoflavus]|uniref:hypothetical protein n=1 Tax=Streptomyces coelicoflavus TaxID=285562 RepID=UPI003B98771A
MSQRSRACSSALAPPPEQRHDEEEHVQRVRLVQAFLAAGVSSGTLVEMVPCMSEPS